MNENQEKQETSVTALHELELMLKNAVADPAARPLFYKALMESSVYVVGKPEEPEKEGEAPHLQLKQWQQPDGSMALPFFATGERLQEILGKDEPVVALAAKELFRLSGGALTLVFTTSEGSKAFKADEIAALLSMSVAQDPLALALIQANEENTDEARRNFYNVLINSHVFVIGHPVGDDGQPVPLENPAGVGHRTMSEDDRFSISSCPHPHIEGKVVIPFFTSPEHLSLMVKEGQKYMGFAAMAFFGMARNMGQQLVLNPGSKYHKFFTEEELDFLLNAAKEEPFEARHFKPGTKVMLGPPAKYPQELVRELLDFLPNHPVVSAAYLVTIREDNEEAPPVLVIGFEADGDLTEMFRAAGSLVGEFAPADMPVDFARIVHGEKGLSQYFLEKVSPFYRRAINGLNATKPQDVAGESSARQEQYDKPGFFGRVKRIFGGK